RTVGGVLLPLVVDRDDRRMVERRRVLGLPTEALVEGLVPGQFRAHDLDGHVPAEDRVAPATDLGHAAVSEGLTDLVAPGQDGWCGHPSTPAHRAGTGTARPSAAPRAWPCAWSRPCPCDCPWPCASS